MHKKIEMKPRSVVDQLRQTLIFTRILGHRQDMPGSGQWRMIT